MQLYELELRVFRLTEAQIVVKNFHFRKTRQETQNRTFVVARTSLKPCTDQQS